MHRFIIIIEGVAGWIECHAADKRAARVYAADILGLSNLPARHCVARIA